MDIVKPIREIIRAKMNECADAGAAQFISAIRSIYGSTNQGRPYHIGTCLFLNIDGSKYLLTAGHVINENKFTSIYVGGSKDMVLVEGEFVSTSVPATGRDDDHYDFAYLKLTDEILKKLGDIDFISESATSGNIGDTTGRLFLALGYPNSKNRKNDPTKKMVQPSYLKYSSTVRGDTGLCQKLGISGKDHLILGYDLKYSKDEEGVIVNSFAPTGISGGALVDMGSIANPERLKAGVQCRGKLAGMLLENHKEYSAMLAVKIGIIIKEIKK